MSVSEGSVSASGGSASASGGGASAWAWDLVFLRQKPFLMSASSWSMMQPSSCTATVFLTAERGGTQATTALVLWQHCTVTAYYSHTVQRMDEGWVDE